MSGNLDARYPAAEKAIRLAFFLRGYELASVEFHGEKGETGTIVLEDGREFTGTPPQLFKIPMSLPDMFTGNLREKTREFQARYTK